MQFSPGQHAINFYGRTDFSTETSRYVLLLQVLSNSKSNFRQDIVPDVKLSVPPEEEVDTLKPVIEDKWVVPRKLLVSGKGSQELPRSGDVKMHFLPYP